MCQVKEEHIEKVDWKMNTSQIKCRSDNKIDKFCTNKDCRFPSLSCRQETCQVCSTNHQQCFFGQFTQLTKRVERRLAFQKTTLSQFFKIENNLIDKIVSSRRQMTDENNLLKVDEKLRKVIQQVYLKTHSNLAGQDMSQSFNQLSLNELKQQAEKYLECYNRQTQNILKNLLCLRENLIESIFQFRPKCKSVSTIQNKPSNKQQNQISQNVELQHVSNSTQPKIDCKNSKKIFETKILLEEDKQKIDYLFKQLKNPSKLQLLFRASQYNFESSRFHRYCNNIPNTLTIIKTEFNKTIAAYTPIQWTSNGYHCNDPYGLSFLLQLDLQERMNLVRTTKAIYDNKKFGPSFGCGDILITDKCNQNCQSYVNPNQYSFGGDKYKKEKQQTWLAFSGAPNGKYFKVIDYEVFKVIQ